VRCAALYLQRLLSVVLSYTRCDCPVCPCSSCCDPTHAHAHTHALVAAPSALSPLPLLLPFPTPPILSCSTLFPVLLSACYRYLMQLYVHIRILTLFLSFPLVSSPLVSSPLPSTPLPPVSRCQHTGSPSRSTRNASSGTGLAHFKPALLLYT
jgi:hypothetical protein